MTIHTFVTVISMVCVVLCPSAGFAVQNKPSGEETAVIRFTENTGDSIAGYSPMAQIAFSSALQAGKGTAIRIRIGKKSIHADYNSSGSLVRLGMEEAGISGGSLTKREERALQRLYENLETSLQNPSDPEIKLLKSIDTIVTLVPPGQRFDLRPSSLQEDESLVTPQAISMICKQRGSCGYAYYSDTNGAHSVNVIVGDPASSCLGRCGAGCNGTSNNKRVYTQECLNHDICIQKVGTGYFGNKLYGKGNQCKDEFNAAVSSFSRGESCSHFLRGKWNVVTTLRPSKTKKIISINKWNLSDEPVYQSPHITSQNLQECTDAGCYNALWYKYPGRKNYFVASTPRASYIDKTIDAYDIKLNGDVYDANFGKGKWTAKHASIVNDDSLQCNE